MALKIKFQGCSLSELAKIKPVKLKGAGAYWKGVPHIEFVEALLAEIEKDWRPVGEALLHVSSDKLSCGVRLEVGDGLVVGGWNTNSQQARSRLYGGMVAPGGGAVMLNEWLLGKHTQSFSVEQQVRTSFQGWKEWALNFTEGTELMSRTVEVPAVVLAQARKEGALSGSLLPLVELAFWRVVSLGARPTAWVLARAHANVSAASPLALSQGNPRKTLGAMGDSLAFVRLLLGQ